MKRMRSCRTGGRLCGHGCDSWRRSASWFLTGSQAILRCSPTLALRGRSRARRLGGRASPESPRHPGCTHQLQPRAGWDCQRRSGPSVAMKSRSRTGSEGGLCLACSRRRPRRSRGPRRPRGWPGRRRAPAPRLRLRSGGRPPRRAEAPCPRCATLSSRRPNLPRRSRSPWKRRRPSGTPSWRRPRPGRMRRRRRPHLNRRLRCREWQLHRWPPLLLQPPWPLPQLLGTGRPPLPADLAQAAVAHPQAPSRAPARSAARPLQPSRRQRPSPLPRSRQWQRRCRRSQRRHRSLQVWCPPLVLFWLRPPPGWPRNEDPPTYSLHHREVRQRRWRHSSRPTPQPRRCPAKLLALPPGQGQHRQQHQLQVPPRLLGWRPWYSHPPSHPHSHARSRPHSGPHSHLHSRQRSHLCRHPYSHPCSHPFSHPCSHPSSFPQCLHRRPPESRPSRSRPWRQPGLRPRRRRRRRRRQRPPRRTPPQLRPARRSRRARRARRRSLGLQREPSPRPPGRTRRPRRSSPLRLRRRLRRRTWCQRQAGQRQLRWGRHPDCRRVLLPPLPLPVWQRCWQGHRREAAWSSSCPRTSWSS